MADVIVLCYHAVSPTWSSSLSVTPDLLERELTLLRRRGWRGATFRQAVFDPPAERTLAVTFDDAFASVARLAYPILSSLGLPGTVFAPTAFMPERMLLAWPGVEHWSDTPFAHELQSMTWEELGHLLENGWEIGSHTRTHPRLTSLADEPLREELAGSRQDVIEHLHTSCDTIAYPYGDVDSRVANAAEAAGYVAGAALGHSLRPLGALRWPRIGVYHADPMWRFRLKINPMLRRFRASRLVNPDG